ncbi:c-type cytochrome [Ascidiaceihabitans sp.]|uniref:c-type cytochrome n=1 Tax=Ascidiaceihabitans sp. TaxID=1872644 RepID=UPI003297C1A7
MRNWIVTTTLCVGVAACATSAQQGGSSPNRTDARPFGGLFAPKEASMPDQAEGRTLFLDYCAQCHGQDAMGGEAWEGYDGPLPANLTTLYARGLDRAQMLSTIDGYTKARTQSLPEGCQSTAQRCARSPRAPFESHKMPEFGLLFNDDLVPIEVDGVLTPVPRALAALMVYLEGVQQGVKK